MLVSCLLMTFDLVHVGTSMMLQQKDKKLKKIKIFFVTANSESEITFLYCCMCSTWVWPICIFLFEDFLWENKQHLYKNSSDDVEKEISGYHKRQNFESCIFFAIIEICLSYNVVELILFVLIERVCLDKFLVYRFPVVCDTSYNQQTGKGNKREAKS